MEFLRRALNPWGEDVPVGVSWDLIWAAVIVGAVFVLVHALMVPKKVGTGEIDEDEAKDLPEKLVRHLPGARGFHWSMSATMFALLITAFFPVIGIQFPWVTIHWIAGVLLILTLLYHIYHVFAKQDFWAMWIGRRDIKEGTLGLKAALRQPVKRPRTAKYPVDQKMFHHAATIATLGAVVTGVLMMYRVENFLLPQNTYMFSDATWGWIYVIHGDQRDRPHLPCDRARLLRDPPREALDDLVDDQRLDHARPLPGESRPGTVGGAGSWLGGRG